MLFSFQGWRVTEDGITYTLDRIFTKSKFNRIVWWSTRLPFPFPFSWLATVRQRLISTGERFSRPRQRPIGTPLPAVQGIRLRPQAFSLLPYLLQPLSREEQVSVPEVQLWVHRRNSQQSPVQFGIEYRFLPFLIRALHRVQTQETRRGSPLRGLCQLPVLQLRHGTPIHALFWRPQGR